MDKQAILAYAKEKHDTTPEYLWQNLPTYAVLRNSNNRKWYAVFMDVPKSKLGRAGEEYIDILDVKCDPALIGSLLKEDGILPGYHMNKGNWITILLDGTVSTEKVLFLLDLSYNLISKKSYPKERVR